jgi:hypothetical protein
MMMNFRRSDLIGLRQEIVHPRRNLELEEGGKRENSKLIKVRGEEHKGKKKNAELVRTIQHIFIKIVLTLDLTRLLAR